MSIEFKKVLYGDLDARQKEVHNFHLIAARLAQYGFATYAIRDDWHGGDMVARHMTDLSQENLTIQIKGRLTFGKKYQGKNIWIGFVHANSDVYIFPHDQILAKYLALQASKGTPLQDNGDWRDKGLVHWGTPTKDLLKLIEPFRLAP